MGDINKWPQLTHGGNKSLFKKEVEIKYNINIEINISSLSSGEKTFAMRQT